MLYFLRLFIHYTGQYVVLRLLQVQVTRFEPGWTRIYLEYAATHFTHEIVVMIAGALANTFVFCGMTGIALIFQMSKTPASAATF